VLRQIAVLRRAAAAGGGGAGGKQPVDLRNANITVAESLVVAAVAGMGNVLLSNPIWMVATRMQAQSRDKRAAPAPGELQPGRPSVLAGKPATSRQPP
jgi:adenine nucleotide transporter 17